MCDASCESVRKMKGCIVAKVSEMFGIEGCLFILPYVLSEIAPDPANALKLLTMLMIGTAPAGDILLGFLINRGCKPIICVALVCLINSICFLIPSLIEGLTPLLFSRAVAGLMTLGVPNQAHIAEVLTEPEVVEYMKIAPRIIVPVTLILPAVVAFIHYSVGWSGLNVFLAALSLVASLLCIKSAHERPSAAKSTSTSDLSHDDVRIQGATTRSAYARTFLETGYLGSVFMSTLLISIMLADKLCFFAAIHFVFQKTSLEASIYILVRGAVSVASLPARVFSKLGMKHSMLIGCLTMLTLRIIMSFEVVYIRPEVWFGFLVLSGESLRLLLMCAQIIFIRAIQRSPEVAGLLTAAKDILGGLMFLCLPSYTSAVATVDRSTLASAQPPIAGVFLVVALAVCTGEKIRRLMQSRTIDEKQQNSKEVM